MTEQLIEAGHGDLYLRPIAAEDVPEAVRERLEAGGANRIVLAYGEHTGHAHVLTAERPIGYVRDSDSIAYVLLRDAGLLVHEEHGERHMAPGYYAVPTERDFDPTEYARRVVD